MTSWSASAVRFYIEYIRRPKATFDDVETVEASIQATYLHPQSFAPPTNLGPDITISRLDINAWPLFRVSPRPDESKASQPESRKAMLYIHGGAYCREIDPVHWKLTAQLARETGLDILVPIYPLVPRPTATAAQVVTGMLEICRGSGHEVVCIAGDSAGGAIALAAVQQMQGVAPEMACRLRCVVLIAPVLDCGFEHPEAVRLAREDPWLSLTGLRTVAKKWAGGLPVDDPRVSPLYGSIVGLPPVLLFAGTADLLCADARRLSARFQGKGADEAVEGSVDVDGFTYVELRDMIHVYPLLPHREGAEARKQMVAFVTKHLI